MSKAAPLPHIPPAHTLLKAYPLRRIPTRMLLRSLLVSTVSSKPILLSPSLSILSFLSRSKSRAFSPDKNPLIHWFLKKTFYEHFCAGENGAEVANTVKQMKTMGYKGVILGYAREVVVDKTTSAEKSVGSVDEEEADAQTSHCTDIESWGKGVLKTVEMIGKDDFLALKLTGAGSSVIKALKNQQPVPKQMKETLHKICKRATEHQVRILVDAEQQSEQLGIDALALDLMREFNTRGVATVYNTYQAYLKATGKTLLSHMRIAKDEGFTLGVKLVRGAYINSEPRHLIHDTKQDTDQMYNSLTQGLLSQDLGDFRARESGGDGFPTAELFLGTHNGYSVKKAQQIYSARIEAGLPTIRVQYGQLLGMADEVSGMLLEMGGEKDMASSPQVYKCLSWGSVGECVSYLLRRAIENRDAVSRTQDGYRAVTAELSRRVKSYSGRSRVQ